jgi:hypothetical protein
MPIACASQARCERALLRRIRKRSRVTQQAQSASAINDDRPAADGITQSTFQWLAVSIGRL